MLQVGMVLHHLAIVHACVFVKTVLQCLICITALHLLELYFRLFSVLSQATHLYLTLNYIYLLNNYLYMWGFGELYLFIHLFKVDITPAAPSS